MIGKGRVKKKYVGSEGKLIIKRGRHERNGRRELRRERGKTRKERIGK